VVAPTADRGPADRVGHPAGTDPVKTRVVMNLETMAIPAILEITQLRV
jgi:hypothetical protein